MKRILLAEDDVDFANVLKQYLELSGYDVVWAKNGVEALTIFETESVDICVLDVMMPNLDGFSVAEKIVSINPEIPFVFLTARQLKEDKIKGLKLGAEDYISKPFEADELVLRLNNILKRTQKISISDATLQIGLFSFDTQRLKLRSENSVQQLTEKEALLLMFLHRNKNRLLRREEILLSVWQTDDFFSGRSMDVFISRLRKYLAADTRIRIESIRNVGLEFRVSS